jgi:menaquinone-dependent protoporphyrinogen IX oxidase
MKSILVTYATMAGSTGQIASVIGEELGKAGVDVSVHPLDAVHSLSGYDGVVLGGPMIMGWHRGAAGFLRRHRKELERMPWAVFVTAKSLTDTHESRVDGVPVCVDAKLPKLPQFEGHLNFRERYAQLAHYVQPILNAARPAKPVSIGLFGGRLEYGRLPWWGVLFVTLVIQAPPADRRNWDAIRAWAAGLPAAMQLEREKATA